MDKRKKLISFLAGLMALIMLLGLIAGFIPVAHAATSGELFCPPKDLPMAAREQIQLAEPPVLPALGY